MVKMLDLKKWEREKLGCQLIKCGETEAPA